MHLDRAQQAFRLSDGGRVSARVSIALLVCAIVGSACAGVRDAKELPGTSWSVVEIDGDEVPGDVLLFLDLDSAILLTQPQLSTRTAPPRSCGESTSEWVWDSDGHAMNFLGFEGKITDVFCDPGMEDVHLRIMDALRENESWEATSDGIELIGSSRVRLVESGSD